MRPSLFIADMDVEGYGTPDEDESAHIIPSKMTINEMKDWLTENGHEDKVWTLTQAKAKKQKYIPSLICPVIVSILKGRGKEFCMSSRRKGYFFLQPQLASAAHTSCEFYSASVELEEASCAGIWKR